MPDPQTPNLGLFVPLNGADVGTWDVPMNANFNLLDGVLGANTTVALTNVPVTLSAAQYNNSLITFSGTLTADVTVTFPQVGRIYYLNNLCVSGVTFRVTCKTAISTTYVALPPGEMMTVICDGTNMTFMGLGRIGSYWDHGGTGVPNWVTGCVPQPYLNCDGTAFSSATYPRLRDYLGGTTLPDARGRFRAILNQGTARLQNNSGTLSIDGNAILNTGGTISISSLNLPNTTFTTSDVGHLHSLPANILQLGGAPNVAAGVDISIQTPVLTTLSAVTGITVYSGGSGGFISPPGYIGGITMIRSG